jgi:hypothetical protein
LTGPNPDFLPHPPGWVRGTMVEQFFGRRPY